MMSCRKWFALVSFFLLGSFSWAANGPQIDVNTGALTIGSSYHRLGTTGPCLHRWYRSNDTEKGMFGIGWKTDFETYLLPDVDGAFLLRRASPDKNGQTWIRIPPLGFPLRDFSSQVRALAAVLRSHGLDKEHSMTGREETEGLVSLLSDDGPLRLRKCAQALETGGFQIPGFDRIQEWRGGGFRITRCQKGFTAVSHSGQYEFDVHGRLLTNGVSDSDSCWNLEYDSKGRLCAVKKKDGSPLVFTYRKDGDVVELVSIDGAILWQGTYDQGGRLLSEKARDGQQIAYSHDENGRVNRYSTSTLDNRFSFDRKGRLTWVREDGSFVKHVFCYAVPGSCTVDLCPPPRSTSKEETVDTGEEDDGCDSSGVEIQVPVRHQTCFESRYGFLFKKSEVKLEGETKEQWQYNSDGLLESHNADGNVKERRYDDIGRLVEIREDGRTAYRLAYADPSGRLAMIQTPEFIATYTYDSRQKNLRKVEHSQLGSMNLLYDAKDRIIRLQTPEGRRLEFLYNEAGKPSRMMLDGKPGLRVTYTPEGEVEKVRTAPTASLKIGLEITSFMQKLSDLVGAAKEAWKL